MYNNYGFYDFDPEVPISEKGKDRFDKLMLSINHFGYFPVILIEKTYGADKTYRYTLIVCKKDTNVSTIDDNTVKTCIYHPSNDKFHRVYASKERNYQYYPEIVTFRTKKSRQVSYGEIADKIFDKIKGKYISYYDHFSKNQFPKDDIELEIFLSSFL